VILVIIVSLLVIVLAVQNDQAMSTKVKFRVNPIIAQEATSPEVSLYQVTIVSFLLGVILTGIYGMVERFRLKKQLRTLTKVLEDKDKELNSLRNLPITSDDVNSSHEQAGSEG
jgi:uncharacterized membrane protein YciS (DUF1049 family)